MPVQARDRSSGLAALDRPDAEIPELLAAAGMTEDELVAEVLADRPGRSQE